MSSMYMWYAGAPLTVLYTVCYFVVITGRKQPEDGDAKWWFIIGRWQIPWSARMIVRRLLHDLSYWATASAWDANHVERNPPVLAAFILWATTILQAAWIGTQVTVLAIFAVLVSRGTITEASLPLIIGILAGPVSTWRLFRLLEKSSLKTGLHVFTLR